MKAVIEVEFKNAKEAKQAEDILKKTKTDEPTRANVKVESKKERLVVIVTALDYSALRALATTVMRDLKVIIDGFSAVGNNE